MTRTQALDASRPRHIHHEFIVEKLEIARTIGLVTDYVVSPTGPPGQVQAQVTVRRSSSATDDGVKEYLAHLLQGFVSTQNITLTPLSATSETRPNEIPERNFRRFSHNSNGMRSVLCPPRGYLQRLATAGAMLICVAVVLNLGPPGKAPVLDFLPHTTDLRGSLLSTEEPTGFPRREVDVRTLPSHSQAAGTPIELPGEIGLLMQPPPFAVADVEPTAFPVPQAKDQRDGIGRRDSGAANAERIREHASAAKPAVVGFWAPDTAACSARDFQHGVLPTVITSEGAWAGETFCIFTNRKETETGWTVVAKCSASRERWTSKIRLAVTNNRLTWTSRRGTQAYTRCSPDILMAQAR
jgi:hypothetical protein